MEPFLYGLEHNSFPSATKNLVFDENAVFWQTVLTEGIYTKNNLYKIHSNIRLLISNIR